MVAHAPPPDIPGIKATGELLQTLRYEVARLLGRDNPRFPGAQPVSFAAAHLLELQRQDYFVCEKSDGVRCLMYLTNDGEQEVTYLIDRKNDYYWVQGLHFPLPDNEQAFNTNTIVDGELVNDREPDGRVQLRYLVFDCLTFDNKLLVNRTLDKRLAYYEQHIWKPHHALYNKYPQEADALPFVVAFKDMQRAYAIQKIFRETLPSLKHGNDGLIFTCRMTPYAFGTDRHIIKWKPADENSVDFRLSIEPALGTPSPPPSSPSSSSAAPPPAPDYTRMPTFRLLVLANNDGYAPFGTMHVTDAEWATLTALQEPLHERIVECYQDAHHRWRYMRFRDDKPRPNHISTVESVIDSIEDRIGEEELVAAQNRIREAWKAREAEAAAAAGGGGGTGGTGGPGGPGVPGAGPEQQARRNGSVGNGGGLPLMQTQKRKLTEGEEGAEKEAKRRVG